MWSLIHCYVQPFRGLSLCLKNLPSLKCLSPISSPAAGVPAPLTRRNRSAARTSVRCWKLRAGRLPASVTNRGAIWSGIGSATPPAGNDAFACLAEGNQVWVKNAPVLLLAVATPNFGHNNQPNRWAQYDTGAASENLCLQATALGLVAHQMGGFNSDQAKATFNIPADHTCMAMIAVGYPGPVERLPEALREKEQSSRQRKPLAQIAFENVWGQGVQ
jgi:hypothetical protein